MKKISIFSREYERKIRRKRFSIISIVIMFSVLIVVYIVNFANVNEYVKDFYYSMVSKQVIKDSDDEKEINISHKSEKYENINVEENKNNVEIYDNEQKKILTNKINLSDFEEVNVLYSMDNNLVEFVGLEKEMENKYKFDISPNKTMMLIDDYKAQSTYLVDSQFNVYNLNPEFFYSNSAKSRFYKNDVMSEYENYAWYKNPKFINDSTVVYVSNLPWFGKNEEYIWKSDVSNLNDIKHFMTPIGGENIDFMELTEEGIKVNINNEIKLLTFSFVLK